MRLQLDARARRWLKRLPVVNLYTAAELALMAVLAAQAARLVWTAVTPVGPLGEWRPAPVVKPASPIDALSGFDPFFRLSGPGEQGSAVVTSLQLQLFGVRLNDATGGGGAIIAGPDGVQKSVSVGEEVAPGVRLAGVAFDHVTLDRGGAREDLYLDQSTVPAPAQTGSAQAAGGAPAAVATPAPGVQTGVSFPQIRQDIGFIPRLDGGRLTGLTVRSQGTGAAFRAAGLRDGDVVTAIAGRPVTGADAIDRIARDYPRGGSVPLTVERSGNPIQLSVTVVSPE